MDTVKAFLQVPHIIYVSLHQWALIILVDLPNNKLRVTPDDELLNLEVCRDPETGKQPFVFHSVVGGHLPGKVHLDYVLEVLSGGCDKQYASPGAMYFDGAFSLQGAGAGVLLVAPTGEHLKYVV